MKRQIIFICLVFIEFTTFAQTTPEQFLQSAPAVPTDVCSMKQTEKEASLQKFDVFEKQLEVEIDRRNKMAKTNEKNNAEAMKAGTLKQSGFDEATIAQMQNATPEQRKALADKMMQQQYNISMADAEKMKNMTKEQREAWAASQGTKVVADAQANPDKYRSQGNNSAEMMEVTKQIQELNQKFKSKETEFEHRVNTLKNDPDAVKRGAEIDELHKKWTSMGGEVSENEAKKMDAIAFQIKTLKSQYCSKYAPKYLLIVKDYLAYVKNTMPDFNKYDQLINKQFQMQTGTDSPMGEKGIMGLEVVKRYVTIARGIFEFDLLNSSEME